MYVDSLTASGCLYLFFPTLYASTKLSMDAIKQIYASGFSRIPVYGKDVNDVLGIVFVKDLVFIDPKESVPLLEFVHVFARAAHRVWADATLGEILSVFKKGGIHMALVYDVNNTGPVRVYILYIEELRSFHFLFKHCG